MADCLPSCRTDGSSEGDFVVVELSKRLLDLVEEAPDIIGGVKVLSGWFSGKKTIKKLLFRGTEAEARKFCDDLSDRERGRVHLSQVDPGWQMPY